jgi:TolB-like protein/Flp pilus assembly protein TadD
MIPGAGLGPYEIVALIGAGGMGEVYRARDTRLGRDVAIKVLPAEFASEPDRLRRFEQEARAVAALDHPNILALYDVGTHEGSPYLVTQLLEGESLRETLDRGPLPIRKAVEVGVQIAQGLAAAHDKGIVHRDLKPGNVFLTKEGRVKILDFGLAKLAAPKSGGEGAPASTVVDATDAGTTLGTAGYMSPEQVRGQAIDSRSDIFSFGCVLYEMIVGRSPFKGDTAADTMSAILKNDPPALAGPQPGVSSSLDHVVKRCLEKRPEDRFSSAHDLAFALSEASGAPVPSAPQTAGVPAGRRKHLLVPVAIGVMAVTLVAAAALLLRSRHAATPGAAGPKRIAVLPFENLGAAEDAYFADGMTDEVRGKLATLPGLTVIARNSSVAYKGSGKSPQAIAGELEVRYLLTGTVRWQTGAGVRRIRVVPELVEIAGTGPATTPWQDSFDAVLEDVFRVQGEIATRVAGALQVALGAGEQQQLAERPTASLAAYDAYLRGQEISGDLARQEPETVRRAVGQYEQAVALDPSFAVAWAQLSHARSILFFNLIPSQALAEGAREAAERALRLAPGLPETRLAMSYYYALVLKDPAQAMEQYKQGLAASPNHAGLITAAAAAEANLGRWQESLAHAEQACSLDPRSGTTTRRLGTTLLFLRRYPEAIAALDRALALAPGGLQLIVWKAMAYLAQGDLDGARAFLAAGGAKVEPTALAAQMAAYYDLVWVLDDAQQRLLLRLTPAAFEENRAGWAIVLTQTCALRGDREQTRRFAEEAQRALAGQLGEAPDDSQLHVLRGLALAYLGRREEAIREGEKGVALEPLARSAYDGVYLQHVLVRIYILVGEPEKALDRLEPLIAMPSYLSPGWLAIDPNFAPLKGNPRFEKLLRARA